MQGFEAQKRNRKIIKEFSVVFLGMYYVVEFLPQKKWLYFTNRRSGLLYLLNQIFRAIFARCFYFTPSILTLEQTRQPCGVFA